jgi:signal transduction histidine kinase
MGLPAVSNDPIRHHPFFALLPPEVVPALAETATRAHYPADSAIFHEGDPSDSLYLVQEGSVRILKTMLATDPPYMLTRVEAGGFFGEYGVLDGSVRSASAVAAVDSTLARIPRAPFLHAIQSMSGAGVMQLLHHILNGIRASNAHYVQELVQRTRMSAVGASLNTILHDFRNPLAVVNIAAGMLRRQSSDANVHDSGTIIEEQVKRMNDMAEDILDFGRGIVRMECVPTNVRTIQERFQRLNQNYLARSRITLEVIPLDAWILADTQKILRVLQNLANNAAEMLPAGTGRIVMQATTDQAWVVLSVQDNGPGIPAAVRTRLFEPFATAGKTSGIGLGLAIVKSITTAHKGTIRVDTAPGTGTTFHLRFPRSLPNGKPWTQGS